MEFTCALDVVDAYPDGVGIMKLAALLGVVRQEARREVRAAKDSEDIALARMRRRMKREGRDDAGGASSDYDELDVDDDEESL